jgi:hypothetical protein
MNYTFSFKRWMSRLWTSLFFLCTIIYWKVKKHYMLSILVILLFFFFWRIGHSSLWSWNQVPLSLAKYIGAGVGVSLPTEQLFKSLVTSLLIPLIIGKVCGYSYLCTPRRTLLFHLNTIVLHPLCPDLLSV